MSLVHEVHTSYQCLINIFKVKLSRESWKEALLITWFLVSSLKRSKGSSHLRRSISQPLDLDKAYDTPVSTLRKCRSPTNTPRRRQRRPSAGNILNEDNTTSEDEIGMSDSEDFRTDLKRSLEEVCFPSLFIVPVIGVCLSSFPFNAFLSLLVGMIHIQAFVCNRSLYITEFGFIEEENV